METKKEDHRRFKLSIFPLNFSTEEILLHKDDFPDLKEGDVLEIYQAENGTQFPRLLLQVAFKSIYNPNPSSSSISCSSQSPSVPISQSPSVCPITKNLNLSRETVYIEKSIAESFHLYNFKDVLVKKVEKDKLVLDIVELTFREQYLGRSEMWRIKSILVDTVVFKNKKVDFCKGAVRCIVNEMWAYGSQVACGIVTTDTKVVFRSPTAMIYLFIQMSSEMWEFDPQGNLYYEKAVNGFLKEMFDRWKTSGASHEVTIVLFSRCFYETKEQSHFPKEMRECLQTGLDGSFYEDFYRVVVQNERFDDWSSTLMELKKCFTDYKQYILEYHQQQQQEQQQNSHLGACSLVNNCSEIPKAYVSSAEKGNFLEVLNMSLNTFENHYLNRNTDRTGQQSIVITPGVGIFEVDRELAQITKQRIIDSGVGSDLICIGEQPLHAVPLLKFHSKSKKKADEYSMPHWINLSFYSYRQTSGVFYPRIKLPAKYYHVSDKEAQIKYAEGPPVSSTQKQKLDPRPYHEYDSKVFEKPQPRNNNRNNGNNFPSDNDNRGGGGGDGRTTNPEGSGSDTDNNTWRRSKVSTSNFEDDSADEDALGLPSFKTPHQSTFNISNNLNHSSTSNRNKNNSVSSNSGGVGGKKKKNSKEESPLAAIEKLNTSVVGSSDSPFDHQMIKRLLLRPGRALINPFDPNQVTVRVTSNRRRWTHIFPKSPSGTYEQIENVDVVKKSFGNEMGITTGVDWKSLTIPASLPITTDYIPDAETLDRDYGINEYTLSPATAVFDGGNQSLVSTAFPTNQQAYLEFVSQRLAQGFQLIVDAPGEVSKKPNFIDYRMAAVPNNEIWLSIGRLYHRIRFNENMTEINVRILKPRSPALNLGIEYRYRFQAPDNDTYEVSWVRFRTEKLQNFNWNHMDWYVCTKGGPEFELTDILKYWRLRFFMLPAMPYLTVTKDIVENKNESTCDKYKEPCAQLEENPEGFHRFMDSCLNEIRRVKPFQDMKKLNTPETNVSKTLSVENSSLEEIVQALRSGIAFYAKTPGFPDRTFLSFDAVTWLISQGVVCDRSNAISLCQEMLEKKMIRHASGNGKIHFKPGYVFYTFVSEDTEFPYKGDIGAFRKEWVEVETLKKRNNNPRFFNCHREMESSKTCRRLEWATLKYQTEHCPETAFELSFNWTVATGALIADVAQTWARKAQQCNFTIVPIPRDPFALPITLDSDPVRGPIFVEICSDFILGRNLDVQDENHSELAMFIFREAIVKKFGFIPCTSNAEMKKEKGEAHSWTDNQYVHCTGNMFALIPTKLQLQTGIQGLKMTSRTSEAAFDTSADENGDDFSSHRFINRYVSLDKPEYDHSKTGFLWSWNFMVSRRWKNIISTGATGDIDFMDRMLSDFRRFCANSDGRLEMFWNEFKCSQI